MSTNAYKFELFCFQRWFILKEFIEKHNISGAFALFDSDTLLYSNLNEFVRKEVLEKNKIFTVTKKYGPQFSIFRNYDVLQDICSLMTEYYTDIEKIRFLEDRFDRFKRNKILGGNCDMTIITQYYNKNKDNILDLISIIDNATFDNSINESDGYRMNNN